MIRNIKAYLEEKWEGDLLDIVSAGSKRFALIFGAHLDNREQKITIFLTMSLLAATLAITANIAVNVPS